MIVTYMYVCVIEQVMTYDKAPPVPVLRSVGEIVPGGCVCACVCICVWKVAAETHCWKHLSVCH